MKKTKTRLMSIVLATVMVLSMFIVMLPVSVSAAINNTTLTVGALSLETHGKLIATSETNVWAVAYGANVWAYWDNRGGTGLVLEPYGVEGTGKVHVVFDGGQVIIPYTVAKTTAGGDDTYAITLGTSIVKWSTDLVAAIDYWNETIYFQGLGSDWGNGQILYALKANTTDDTKNKYFPIYSEYAEIDISKYVPKKAGDYKINLKVAATNQVMTVTVPSRPAAPGKTDVTYANDVLAATKEGYEVQFGASYGWYPIASYVEEVPFTAAVAADTGINANKTATAAKPAIASKTSLKEVTMYASTFPTGGAALVRIAATDKAFASATVKFSIKASPKAPKLSVEATKTYATGEKDDKNKDIKAEMPNIKGIKAEKSHQLLLPAELQTYLNDNNTVTPAIKAGDVVTVGYSDVNDPASWIDVPYNTTLKISTIRAIKAAIKAASYTTDNATGEAPTANTQASTTSLFSAISYPKDKDGNYLVPIRTAASSKAGASQIAYVPVKPEYFKAPTPTAAIADVTITAAASATSLATSTIVVTLKDGTFANASMTSLSSGGTLATKVSSVKLTAAGIEIKSVVLSDNDTKATFTIGGALDGNTKVAAAAVTKATIDDLKIDKELIIDEDGSVLTVDVTAKGAKATVEITAPTT